MIEIIPMTNEHIDGVLNVEETCFSIPWGRQDFLREINENTMAIYIVAIEDGKIMGYAGMWHVVNEGHITNVAVLHDYRRLGIADKLMTEFINIALQKEMIGITLEVRMSNMGAQKLYLKYGFRSEGIRKNYYIDTKEDAIIMWKYLPNYEEYQKEEYEENLK